MRTQRVLTLFSLPIFDKWRFYKRGLSLNITLKKMDFASYCYVSRDNGLSLWDHLSHGLNCPQGSNVRHVFSLFLHCSPRSPQTILDPKRALGPISGSVRPMDNSSFFPLWQFAFFYDVRPSNNFAVCRPPLRFCVRQEEKIPGQCITLCMNVFPQ